MIGAVGPLLLIGTVLGLPAQEAVPRVVLERFVVTSTQEVRVSLFDTRIAVVSVRQGGERVRFRKTMLSVQEYGVYLQAIRRDAKSVRTDRKSNAVRGVSSAAKIFISVEPGETAEVAFSPFEVLELPLARLNAVLDDLQQRVEQSHPYEEQILTWKPSVGDRVELQSGQSASLIEIRATGELVFRHDRTRIVEIVPPDSILEVVLRIVEGEQ